MKNDDVPATAVAATRAPRILVVDEEEPLTNLLSLTLKFEGWEPTVAATGQDALERVEAFQPDAILLDITLPDMSGVDVATTLRARGLTTPIIFVTGRSTLEDRLAAYAAGGDDYLTKPFGLEDAVERLARVFRRSGILASSIVVGDLVLDSVTSEAWRAGEPLLLDPIESELLAILMGSTAPLTLAQLRAEARSGGLPLTERALARCLEGLGTKVNGDELAVIIETDAGEWYLRPPVQAQDALTA